MPRSPFPAAASALSRVGNRFYGRGWMLGTSGNLSAVVSRNPLRLAITASGTAKGSLTPKEILVCDAQGAPVGRQKRSPSAETLLHVEIATKRHAGAVLHTHSVWSTLLSDQYAAEGGFAIEGYEMLKGLRGVTTHEHCEWIPILENDQDMRRLSATVGRVLEQQHASHAFLLRRHGLYTWGETIDEAERHVEILEFLFEALAQRGRLWHS